MRSGDRVSGRDRQATFVEFVTGFSALISDRRKTAERAVPEANVVKKVMGKSGAVDGARTRDPRRDRPVL